MFASFIDHHHGGYRHLVMTRVESYHLMMTNGSIVIVSLCSSCLVIANLRHTSSSLRAHAVSVAIYLYTVLDHHSCFRNLAMTLVKGCHLAMTGYYFIIVYLSTFLSFAIAVKMERLFKRRSFLLLTFFHILIILY